MQQVTQSARLCGTCSEYHELKQTSLLHIFSWEDKRVHSLAQPSWQASLQSHSLLTIISAFHKAQSLIRHNYLKFLVLFCIP